MAMLSEKEIRGYQLKTKEFVCALCASGEEKADSGTKVVAEDVIHDSGPMECARCKATVK